MNIVPIVMVKNEEIWIERVLTSLSRIFHVTIVADTGSTDNTVKIVESVPNMMVLKYLALRPDRVGHLRGEMQRFAKQVGATHVMLVDGDELYPTEYLEYIYSNPMPESAPCGFTTGVEVCELDNGELWLMNATKNRDAVFSVDSQWHGVYPFEAHTEFDRDPSKNYYWPSPDPKFRFYHLHNVRRSRFDGDVHMRLTKKGLFSMQKRPDIHPETLWLKSEKEYKDEYFPSATRPAPRERSLS